MRSLQKLQAGSQDDHWIPLSDLMTGLMMMFLLIAIVYMIKVEADKNVIKAINVEIETRSKKMKEIAILYEQLKTQLYNDLLKEFGSDLPRWGAELDRDATIRFKEPDVLFASGSWDLKQRFKQILDEFFPRYISILYSDKYRAAVTEVRIEGHTSSFWKGAPTEQSAYFQNMKLSQDRTRSTLEYVLALSGADRVHWLREHLTANGLASSKPILNPDHSENFSKSQRVEFRVRTDSESRLERIIQATE